MSKTTKTTLKAQTGLVISTPSILESLQAELKGLQTIASTPYKTGNSLINGVDLSSETSIANIIKAVGSAMTQEQVYNNAQMALKVTKAPSFTISGHSAKVIVETAQLRIQVLEIEDRRKELEALVAEAKEFVTKEDKFVMFQAKLEAAGVNLV